VAVLTAAILLLARVLPAGVYRGFLSRTVLVGFLTGVGLQVGISVLERDARRRRGFTPAGNRALGGASRIAACASAHGSSGGLSADICLAAAPLRSQSAWSTGSCGAAITASAAWNFAGHGIATIGPVVGGLPHLALTDCSACAP